MSSTNSVGLVIGKDRSGQTMIQWLQSTHWKRAWIQRKADLAKDWAGAERYINVVRVEDGRPAGNPTDFPVFTSPLSDEELLIAFVTAICAMTGCRLPPRSDWQEEAIHG